MEGNIQLSGSRVILESLLEHNVDTVFGYPGGAIMPLYDALYDYKDRLRHILTRHEQGAVHAAQGYARATGRVGVCFVTSGPGATNTVTGIADAMLDSTPLVVISGQVVSSLLGVDSFQETNFIGITQPISKWNILVRHADEVADAINRAIYIATSGRPGPVVVDITKDAQAGLTELVKLPSQPVIRSYRTAQAPKASLVAEAAAMISEAKRPILLFGQGVILSGAEQELRDFIAKSDIPATSTLLGLSALERDHDHFFGMIGMHGFYAPNMTNSECDLLIAVGMRFDDRVTCSTQHFAQNAKIIHIDIDPAEIDKIINVDLGIVADAKLALQSLTQAIEQGEHSEWIEHMRSLERYEREEVITPDIESTSAEISLCSAVSAVSRAYKGEHITVTDVGQHQMAAARYSQMQHTRSLVTSGGLGTMGFGLPAAIGAAVGCPDREVVLFVGDGGIQMTIQELTTIMQEQIKVKIVLLNNSFLGMVRQWQELFFDRRYSFTPMHNPNFELLARANGIEYGCADSREVLEEEVAKMKSHQGAYLLEMKIAPEDNIFPMVPADRPLNQVLLHADDK